MGESSLTAIIGRYLEQGYFILGKIKSNHTVLGLQASPRKTSREKMEILEAFAGIPEHRQASGQRHDLALCLALFTLAIAAGNRGFLAIGDWIESYRQELIDLFKPPKGRLPSYSTIRRILIKLDYQGYSIALANFFWYRPITGRNTSL